jgi:hypothetical protein
MLRDPPSPIRSAISSAWRCRSPCCLVVNGHNVDPARFHTVSPVASRSVSERAVSWHLSRSCADKGLWTNGAVLFAQRRQQLGCGELQEVRLGVTTYLRDSDVREPRHTNGRIISTCALRSGPQENARPTSDGRANWLAASNTAVPGSSALTFQPPPNQRN